MAQAQSARATAEERLRAATEAAQAAEARKASLTAGQLIEARTELEIAQAARD